MKFGFVLPNNFGVSDPRVIIDLAVECEDLGLDSVWVNHHVLNEGYIHDRLGDKPYHDALVMLSWAAARTERVRLGTSVLVMPYLHPMTTAKSLATLDQLSGGRVIAGLGVGSLPDENAQLGVIYEGRGPWSDEFIQVMTALWSEGAANFAGEYFSLTEAIASPKPAQSPLPVWIGGSGNPAQRRAAKYGHGWHPMCSVEGLAKRMPSFVDKLQAEGRQRSEVTVAPRIDVRTANTPELVQGWIDAGADELILSVNSGDLDIIRSSIATLAPLVGTFT